ncbi:gliding motility protein GldN [Flavobacterium sp.]|uniref:type IX secretion system ring protein PorN/GldN n=1 Tax=Flavobacterium sp. TaxID=239 RepID=UPI0025EF0330|nr:gliding motility protein GldN [Flavobacterium sp.]
MNVRSFLIAIFSISCGVASFGQSNLLNAKTPSQIGIKSAAQLDSDNDKPLAYGYVHDRDILMSRMTWEVIDLGEKINFPLYFPIDTANVGTERRSLYDVLIKGIKKGKITEVYTDSYFNTKKSFKDIKASLSRIDTTDAGREQLNAGQKISPEYIVQQDLTSQDVTQYKIKGLWYFDKRQSELKYRLLGICPVTPDVYTMNSEDPDFIELFWVFFPDARETLYSAKAFNEKNSSMPISFDQILNSRRFNSVIYKEENVYGDRDIKDYMKDNAQNQLLESDRVKDKIRSFEQDMWNY